MSAERKRDWLIHRDEDEERALSDATVRISGPFDPEVAAPHRRGWVIQYRDVMPVLEYNRGADIPEHAADELDRLRSEVERLRGIIAEAREVFANSIPGEGDREGTDDAMDVILMRSGIEARP